MCWIRFYSELKETLILRAPIYGALIEIQRHTRSFLYITLFNLCINTGTVKQ